MAVYCEKCDELWWHEVYCMRYDEYHKPQKQLKIIKYCPLCGTRLTEFNGWKDEKKYWW